MKKKGKMLKSIVTTLGILAIQARCYATDAEQSTIGTAEVTAATDNIKRVITSIAMPLGGVLIFASVVVAALKMIANSNNPQKRSETIGSLAWICGGGVILGASLIIAEIIDNNGISKGTKTINQSDIAEIIISKNK